MSRKNQKQCNSDHDSDSNNSNIVKKTKKRDKIGKKKLNMENNVKVKKKITWR